MIAIRVVTKRIIEQGKLMKSAGGSTKASVTKGLHVSMNTDVMFQTAGNLDMVVTFVESKETVRVRKKDITGIPDPRLKGNE